MLPRREQQEIDKEGEGREEKAAPQPCPAGAEVTRGENDNVKSAMDDDEEEVGAPNTCF